MAGITASGGRIYVNIDLSGAGTYAHIAIFSLIPEQIVGKNNGGVDLYPSSVVSNGVLKLYGPLNIPAAIYDISGKHIMNIPLGAKDVCVKFLPAGVYFLRTDDGKIRTKFVVIN